MPDHVPTDEARAAHGLLDLIEIPAGPLTTRIGLALDLVATAAGIIGAPTAAPVPADKSLQRGSNSGGGEATTVAVDKDVDPGDGQSSPEPGPATPPPLPPLPVLARILDHAVTAEFGPDDHRGVGEVILDTIIDEANRDTVTADLVAAGFLVEAGTAYLLDDGTIVRPDGSTWNLGTRIQLYRIGGGS